jgi:hypothetical protein
MLVGFKRCDHDDVASDLRHLNARIRDLFPARTATALLTQGLQPSR